MSEERREDQEEERAKEPADRAADPKVEDLAVPEDQENDVRGGAGKVTMQDF